MMETYLAFAEEPSSPTYAFFRKRYRSSMIDISTTKADKHKNEPREGTEVLGGSLITIDDKRIMH